MHEYPPGIANVSLFDGTEPNLSAMGELPLDLLVELGGPGVFFNAKPSGHGANLRLERTLRVMDGGVMYIPFVAIHDINEGDGGYWDYEPDKGLGGADSYHFKDSVWGNGAELAGGTNRTSHWLPRPLLIIPVAIGSTGSKGGPWMGAIGR